MTKPLIISMGKGKETFCKQSHSSLNKPKVKAIITMLNANSTASFNSFLSDHITNLKEKGGLVSYMYYRGKEREERGQAKLA